MVLSARLEVRQSQSLTLTPQLMQSIRLLQLSHIELNAFVEAELLRNPLLEREDGGEPEAESPAAVGPDTLGEVGDPDQLRTASSIAEGYDTAVENIFPEEASREPGAAQAGRGDAAGAGEDAPELDQFVAARPSLADHLAEQAGLILAAPSDRLVAQALIASLDPAGYLDADCAEIAERLGTDAQTVEAVLLRVQGSDPVGVYARNLAECLAIQLRERDRLDPMMARLLRHLDLVAAHDLVSLARLVGCDREDLADMLAEIRTLDPRPGLAFDGAPVQAVIPDVFVRQGPDGDWRLELNPDVLPRVLVNRAYYASVSARTRDADGKSFLTDCLATANWLTRSLDQRAQTILKVAAEIVRQQEAFLTHGIAHLRPMTLRAVAEAIDMHESTVSRVTANKYLATPRGLLEMKYFFTTALASTSGEADHSAEAVRHRIKQMIDAEAADDILSDDTIAAALKKEQGIEVARRTVAKYREGMGIPSSVIRRRQKKALAAAG